MWGQCLSLISDGTSVLAYLLCLFVVPQDHAGKLSLSRGVPAFLVFKTFLVSMARLGSNSLFPSLSLGPQDLREAQGMGVGDAAPSPAVSLSAPPSLLSFPSPPAAREGTWLGSGLIVLSLPTQRICPIYCPCRLSHTARGLRVHWPVVGCWPSLKLRAPRPERRRPPRWLVAAPERSRAMPGSPQTL